MAKNKITGQDAPQGSVGWLIFWIFIFFPVAIAYYLLRSWGK